MTPVLIVQISDLHARPAGVLAYGVSDTNRFLDNAIAAIRRLDPQPDFVLVTGDLTECGLDEEYGLVREQLARLAVPVFAIPGNHDRRDAFHAAFGADGYLPPRGPLNYAAQLGRVRLVALDSVVPGESHGALSADTLAFLDAALAAAPAAPTLIMLHHPPFDSGIGHMDRVGLREGRDAFARIVAGHRQVQRILCGHIHRPIQRLLAGTLCQTAPSVAHQVALDLRPDAPSQFMLEPPAFLVHRFDGEQIVSHTAMVDQAPGPFPFVLPAEYPGHPGATGARWPS